MNKDTKDKLDAATQTVAGIAKSKKGIIIAIFVLLLIFFNTVWNIGNQINGVKAQVDTLSNRVTQTEKSTLDFDAVKADIQAIHKAGELFELKLNALIKAEEARLAILTQELENQKAYIEELKNLSAQESGK